MVKEKTAMIKAAIYDLDELMVDSTSIHEQADGQALKKFGFDLKNLPENVYFSFVGMRVIDMYKSIIKKMNLDIDLDKILKIREEIFLKLVNEKLELMPGLEESLNLFKNIDFKIGLASSGTTKYINEVLDKFLLKQYFDIVVSGNDVKKGKPDPETFTVATKKLGLQPDKCVVLEDATHGIESAKAAGCYCIAVDNDMTPPQDFSKADLSIKSLNYLTLDVIQSLMTKK